jgi:hypothetical protein
MIPNIDSKNGVRYEETQYGFVYGAAEITRIHSDDKKGWVILQIRTPRKAYQIYVTKFGKVRFFDEKHAGKELL